MTRSATTSPSLLLALGLATTLAWTDAGAAGLLPEIDLAGGPATLTALAPFAGRTLALTGTPTCPPPLSLRAGESVSLAIVDQAACRVAVTLPDPVVLPKYTPAPDCVAVPDNGPRSSIHWTTPIWDSSIMSRQRTTLTWTDYQYHSGGGEFSFCQYLDDRKFQNPAGTQVCDGYWSTAGCTGQEWASDCDSANYCTWYAHQSFGDFILVDEDLNVRSHRLSQVFDVAIPSGSLVKVHTCDYWATGDFGGLSWHANCPGTITHEPDI